MSQKIAPEARLVAATVVFRPDQLAHLKRLAAQEQLSVSAYLRKLVDGTRPFRLRTCSAENP